MKVDITADGDGARSLAAWLSQDNEVRRVAGIRLRGEPAEGQLGALDIVQATIDNLTGLTGLLYAIAQFHVQRAQQGRGDEIVIRIVIEKGDQLGADDAPNRKPADE